jgi:hypothetical protein
MTMWIRGVVLAGGMAILCYSSAMATRQAAPLLPGQGIPRCAIPKEFGRLVQFVPGSDTGIRGQVTASKSASGDVLAGQALFEAPDGTIRWVAVVAAAGATGAKPALRLMPRNFPVMPVYDCAVAQVWERR